MHCLFLGTARDLIASCLRVLVEKGAFDSHRVPHQSEELFACITNEIHTTFKEHKPPVLIEVLVLCAFGFATHLGFR